jgi:aryl-alcohol dehydrogenase-like predicted oxidoreductase
MMEARMIARTIPSSGEEIPVVGLGTWQTFDVGTGPAERARLQEVLKRFAELGGRVVDTSPMYGQAETVLGDLMAAVQLRPKLFVATKVWTSGKNEGVRQMESSLRKLRTDTVDLMQVHNLVDVEAHLATLEGWKRDGRVRYVGITHYTASGHDPVARLLASRTLDFVQINYSVGEREAERRVLPLAQERGVAVLINRPFGGGGLLRRLHSRPLPAWAGELGCQTWSQLLLKWVIAHPAVTCAIPATSSVAHLTENMQAGDGPLPDERQRAEIAAAAR